MPGANRTEPVTFPVTVDDIKIRHRKKLTPTVHVKIPNNKAIRITDLCEDDTVSGFLVTIKPLRNDEI